MSGLSNRSNKTFLTINKEGKIQVACAAGTEGAIVKNGKSYLTYSDITGKITGLGTRDREYEGVPYIEQWVDITDKSGTTYQLQFRVSSGYFRSFVAQLPNVDLTKEVSFSPSLKEDTWEGKARKNYALFLAQGGKNVGFYFTKATPHDMPELEPIVHKGKTTGWDSEARDKFCLDYVNTTVATKVMSPAAAIITGEDPEFTEETEEEANPFHAAPSDGDLPF